MRLPRLKELREKRGMSQGALSQKADVSRDSISSYERGVREAHPGTAKKLASALEVDVENLMEMEKVEVEVRWEGPNDTVFGERLRFTGELLDSYEGRSSGYVELYECPGGYRVWDSYEGSYGIMSYLYPSDINRFTGDLDYGFYTAEEVVENYPQFADALGVMRVRDID